VGADHRSTRQGRLTGLWSHAGKRRTLCILSVKIFRGGINRRGQALGDPDSLGNKNEKSIGKRDGQWHGEGGTVLGSPRKGGGKPRPQKRNKSWLRVASLSSGGGRPTGGGTRLTSLHEESSEVKLKRTFIFRDGGAKRDVAAA